ncbi:MAG: DUF4398 domain-containing protein [Archangium sp.]|nr:DUF4398 domain-containing protein [Archangium sp.]
MFKKSMLGLAVVVFGACASVQIPPDRVQRSEASVRAASELGAESVPAARLHLQMAKDQAVAAKRLAADGDERASLVMARSEADAELALALAREVAVRTEAVRAANELRSLQSRETPATP